ncbi:MAG: acyltransferase family protein [Eubacteriales bacterium]|nr:acyltransferase family protein [Eubacteriales bacterium]
MFLKNCLDKWVHLRVPVFFVLSGYLITRNLTQEIMDTKTFSFRTFWAKRIRRLVPLILTVTSFAVIVSAFVNRIVFTKTCKDLLSAIFCYNNWWQIFNDMSYFENAGAPSPLTHFWALAVEIQFYLVFPVLVFLLSRLKNKEKITLRVVIVLAIGSAILMAVLFNPDKDPTRVYYGTDTRLFSFMFGAILSFMTGSYRKNEKIPKSLPDIIGIPSLFILLAMMCLCDGKSPFLYRGGYVLVSLFAVAVIYTVLDHNSILGKVLGCAPLKWVGDRSYSIYLWHYVIIIIISGGKQTSIWVHLLEIVVSVVLAALGYRFIETPVRHRAISKSLNMLQTKPLTESGRKLKSRILKKMCIVATICVAILLTELSCIAFVPRQEVGNIAQQKQELQEKTQKLAKQRIKELAEQKTEMTAEEKTEISAEQKTAVTSEQKTAEPAKKKKKISDKAILKKVNLLLLGDSIALDAIDYFYEYLPNSICDCKIGRCSFEGIEAYDDNVSDGWDGDGIIFELCSNFKLKDELQEMRDHIGPDKAMFIVNIVTPYEGFWEYNNKKIRKFVEKTDNTYLINWNKFSKGHPEYFDTDETHLLPKGAKAYAKMIKYAVLKVYRAKYNK